MKRTIIRKHVFMILFRAEFHNMSELKDQEQLYLNEVEDITAQEREYIIERVNTIIQTLPQIDAKIKNISEGWKFERVGKVELAILRLGIFEMLFDDDIPVNVALNEAVELAKKYGGETSHSFINGVLGKLVIKKAGSDTSVTEKDAKNKAVNTEEVKTEDVKTKDTNTEADVLEASKTEDIASAE